MATHEAEKEEAQSKEPTSSPNDLTQYRQAAQQNSIDALRAAEDRYEKAKQSSATALGQSKKAAAYGLGSATAYVAGKGAQAKDSAVHGMHAAGDYAAEKGLHGLHAAKDTAVSGGRKAADYTQQVAGQTKDYVAEKGQQAKDAVVHVGRRAVDYTGEKAGEAKDAVAGPKRGQIKHEHGEQKSRETEEGELDIGEERAADIPPVDVGDQNNRKYGDERYGGNVAAGRQESGQKTGSLLGDERYGGNVAAGRQESGQKTGSLLGAVGETVVDIARSTKNLVIGGGSNGNK